MKHTSLFSLIFVFTQALCKPQFYYNTFVYHPIWFPVYPFVRVPFQFITIVPTPIKDSSPEDLPKKVGKWQHLENSSNVEQFLFHNAPIWTLTEPQQGPFRKEAKEKCPPDEQYTKQRTISEKLQYCILKVDFNVTEIVEDPIEELTCIKPNDYGSCKCAPFKECEWSNKIVERLEFLETSAPQKINRHTPAFLTGVAFFQRRTCDLKKVFCCNDSQYPTDKQTKILKKLKPGCEEPPTSSSGKWKPDGIKGECGAPTILNNILGGDIAKNGEYPHMALLMEGGEIKCSGTLINKRYVLTAAHCIKNTDEFKQKGHIIVGEHVLGVDPDCTQVGGFAKLCNPNKIKINIANVMIHEEFDPINNANDIALIRLDSLVPLHNEDASKSVIAPICLPWNEKDYGRDLFENAAVRVTGWGKVTNLKISKSNSDRTLRDKELKMANAKCPEIQTETQLCAGTKTTKSEDNCNVDAGGPLISREFSGEPWYQVGIRSDPKGEDCKKSKPGVYTKVEVFLPWIDNNLEE